MNNQNLNLMNNSEIEYIPQNMELVPLIDTEYNSSEEEQIEHALSNHSD